MTTRRQFLQSAALAGSGVLLTPHIVPAIEPIRRNQKSHIRLSIAAYSYNKLLNLKGKDAPTMTLDDFVDRAAEMDLDAVEFTAYYFRRDDDRISGTPQGQVQPARPRRQRHGHRQQFLRHRSGEAEGADCVGQEVDRNLVAARRQDHAHLCRQPLEKGDTEDKARARCVEAIQEACDHAAQVRRHPGAGEPRRHRRRRSSRC